MYITVYILDYDNIVGLNTKIFTSKMFFFSQGTEVKAITYSNMQVYDEPNKHEVYVIVDI